MMTHNIWMASIHLKDAYYSIKLHSNHQKITRNISLFPGIMCTIDLPATLWSRTFYL